MTYSTSTSPMILWAKNWALRPRSAGAEARVPLVQPANWVDYSDYNEVTFVIIVDEVLGAPSSFSLKPTLQYGQMSVGGTFGVDGASGPAVGWQYTKSRWFDVADINLETDVVGGKAAWFPEITGPGVWKATVRNFPPFMRIDLGEVVTSRFVMNGGTDPRLVSSGVAYPKKV